MKKLFLAFLLLLVQPAFAFQGVISDGNVVGRSVGAGAGLEQPIPIQTTLLAGGVLLQTPGLYLQPNVTSNTPATLTSWITGNNVGGKAPYSYLATFALLSVPNNSGEMGVTGASHTAGVTLPAICCSMGLAGSALNDNSSSVQTAWPLYATGSRLASTGAIQNEFDIANVSNDVVDVNPYQPTVATAPGSSIILALGAGGEPATVGSTPLGAISAGIVLGSNGENARHGLVVANNLFSGSYCTTNCPAIDLAYGHEIRWVSGTSDSTANGSFIRGNQNTTGAGNGLVFNQFGALFENAAGGILGQVAQNASMAGVAYPELSSTGTDALITPGSGNGISNANLQLGGLGTGHIQINAPLTMYAATAGANTPSAPAASPCAVSATWKWLAVTVTGQAGTWYMPVCQ